MTTIAEALSALATGVKIVKDLNQIDREFDKASLKLHSVELAGSLTTVHVALNDAETQLREKSREIERLREAFRQKEELVEVNGYHYRRTSEGEPQGPPFCPICLQDGRLCMTAQTSRDWGGLACPRCKADYAEVPEYHFEGEEEED